jgi:hypothetical protein
MPVDTRPRLSPEERAAYFAARWTHLAGRDLRLAAESLSRLSADARERLDPALVLAIWEKAEHSRPGLALSLLKDLPSASRAHIAPERQVRLWERHLGNTGAGSLSIRSCMLALGGLGEEALRDVVAQVHQYWHAVPGVPLLHLPLAPRSIRDSFSGEQVEHAWSLLADTQPHTAFDLLSRLPSDLLDRIPPSRVEERLLAHRSDFRIHTRLGGTHLSSGHLLRLPERYASDVALQTLCTVVRQAARADRWGQKEILEAFPAACERIRAAVPVGDVVRVWRGLAAEDPWLAIRTLSGLPAGHTREIEPGEVEDLWRRGADSSLPSISRLAEVSALPRRLRAWLDAKTLRRALRDVRSSEDRGSDELLAMLAALPPDLRALVPEQEVQDLLGQRVAPAAAQTWLDSLEHSPEERSAAGLADVAPRAFQISTMAFPDVVLDWLVQAPGRVQQLIPVEEQRRAWRRWLVQSLSIGRSDALHWAGAETPGLAPADDRDLIAAPEAFRPVPVGDQVRLALLEALEGAEPEEGVFALGHLPEALRPDLPGAVVQRTWGRLLEYGRPRAALLLLECVPTDRYPTVSDERAAALLQSNDAEVRLRAIRLMPLLRSHPSPALEPCEGRTVRTDDSSRERTGAAAREGAHAAPRESAYGGPLAPAPSAPSIRHTSR